MSQIIKPVIVGAGPAGLRAAHVLASAGLRPLLLDEGIKPGGQIYRQQPDGFSRTHKTLYGFEHKKARALHELGEHLQEKVDYIRSATVWDACGNTLSYAAPDGSRSVSFTHVILATGATDRVLPFPGWLLPGVYTLGAAQIALKYQGCSIGSKVVLAGTGPLLYLVAYQYAKSGVDVVAVLDTSPFMTQLAHGFGLLAQPGLLAKGLYYLAWLRAHGIPVHTGVEQLKAEGTHSVSALSWQESGKGASSRRQVACDAVGFGYMLRSESQLASLLGCQFIFNQEDQAWVPETDRLGRSSVRGVYLAGDGVRIGGADVAETAGELAALALLEDAGCGQQAARAAALLDKQDRAQRFRTALNKAFPLPAEWAASVPDDLVVCRCEEITAGQIRAAARDTGALDISRAKALVRVGMGRCQGRMCGVAAAQLMAHELGVAIQEVGRIRSQTPVKPIPIQALARIEEARE